MKAVRAYLIDNNAVRAFLAGVRSEASAMCEFSTHAHPI